MNGVDRKKSCRELYAENKVEIFKDSIAKINEIAKKSMNTFYSQYESQEEYTEKYKTIESIFNLSLQDGGDE
jgi:hypothetical protein